MAYPGAPTMVDASPLGTTLSIVVSSQGEVLHQAQLASGKQLVLTDSLGRVLGEFGPRGPGPGEVVAPIPLEISDSVVSVFDLVSLRVTDWGRDGTLRRVLQFEQPIIPRTPLAARWIGFTGSADGFSPVLLDMIDGRIVGRPTSSKPFLDSLMRSMNGGRSPPAASRWLDGVVLGDGMSYRIGFFDSAGKLLRRLGRKLGPNYLTESQVAAGLEEARSTSSASGKPIDPQSLARLEKSLRKPQPWFSHTAPLQFDQDGRFWVVGVTHDSVFADVFDSVGGVERHRLDCPGFSDGWSVTGGWLPVIGAAPEAAEYAAMVGGAGSFPSSSCSGGPTAARPRPDRGLTAAADNGRAQPPTASPTPTPGGRIHSAILADFSRTSGPCRLVISSLLPTSPAPSCGPCSTPRVR